MASAELPRIGNFQPSNPFFLAPMEAVNCASFRLVCKRRGAAIVYTDMIDADMFTEYAKKNGSAAAIKHYVNPQADEYPLGVQLGGANINNLKFAISHLESVSTVIDYNVGCPLPYMLAKKGGVYLSKHPDQLKKIIAEMRKAITKVPFTVKIRLGWDEKSTNAVEVAKLLESLGVDAITLHARTRKQGYRDRADWALARKVKEAINVPFILSGDVTNPYMAYMAFAHTKCDYILIARGAQNNPSVFAHLNEWYEKDRKEKPEATKTTYNKNKRDCEKYFFEFTQLYKTRENRHKISELKDHALWTARECKNAAEIKQRIIRANNESELLQIIKSIYF